MTTEDFPWGTIVKVHKIGPYSITEYVSGDAFPDAGQTFYQGPNGSFPTLEWAMLDVVCNSADHKDYHLTGYAGRLIGLKAE